MLLPFLTAPESYPESYFTTPVYPKKGIMYNRFMRIFFAGPLTNLRNPTFTKALYKKMGDVATECGFDYFWAFQRGTDPDTDPNVNPDYIYYKDLKELEDSNLMIAYMGEPSAGTGQELEYAKEHNIPAYLVFEKNAHVSRMIIGNPAVKGTIAFADETDALDQLRTLLRTIKGRVDRTS
jgi:2'-deoxynucleoside 5'-phosphate N-hydrolase